jgi:hypothetical protein
VSDANGSVIRAIRGPVTLITLGALFALNNFTRYTFDQTWPVLLIVFGLLTLLRRGVESPRNVPPPPGAPPYAQPPYNAPPYPGDPAAGGYRDSRYRQPATDPGGHPPAGGAA